MAPGDPQALSPAALSAAAKRFAADLGFAACGVADLASSSASAQALDRWLAAGMHGEMSYMQRQAAIRKNPLAAWPQCRSVVVVLDTYSRTDAAEPAGYRVARYAQGLDYHRVTRERLELLGSRLTGLAQSGSCRCYVDAGPMPERELAWRAGLGWLAKNGMLINPTFGSYTFIGVLLTDLVLARDEPFDADRCGTCTRCLEACPTGALPEPRVVDARLCISYLTIEKRGAIPPAMHAAIGDRLFGCDICQEVCPWNVKFAPEPFDERHLSDPSRAWPAVAELVDIEDEDFERRFGDTALERAGAAGIRRNAAIVASNLSAGGAQRTGNHYPEPA